MGWLVSYAVFHVSVALLVFWYFYNMYHHHTFWTTPPTPYESRVHHTVFALAAGFWPMLLGWFLLVEIWD